MKEPEFKQGDIVEYFDSDRDRFVCYISLWREDKGKYALCRNTCEIGHVGKDYKAGKLVFENDLRLVKSI